MGVELAARADVKKLAIFHHDPNATDEQISEFFSHTENFFRAPGMQSVNPSLVSQELRPQEDSPRK